MASVKRRPDGRWRARYRGPDGRERARHFDRKIDAQRWLDETAASMVTGQYVQPEAGRVTFRAWFAQWSERQVWQQGTRESAYQAAESVTFADLPMRSIMPSHAQQWVKAMSARLAPSTIRTRYNYVHMAMRAAVVDRIIATDPTAGVSLPRARKAAAAMTIPTTAEIGSALDTARPDFRAFVGVCAFAGLRLGEAAGLQLEDVDFLRRTISLRRQVQGSSIPTTRIAAPKCGSERVVFVPEQLTMMLAEHVQRFGVRAGGWLFSTGGQPYNRQSAGEQWRRVRRAAGLAARLPALLRFRTHSRGLRRGDGAAGAGALVGDDHARRLQPSLADGRGPDADGRGGPDGDRSADFCGLRADRQWLVGR